MTSLAQLPPLDTLTARALGNRVKLLSRKSAASPALNRCAWRNLRPIQRRNRQEPGPTFTPGRSPLPAVALGETPSKTTSFGEQYSRHLVDVKCITLHLVFYAFPARTKRVTPLLVRPDFESSGTGRGVGSTMPPLPRTACQHAFRHPFFRVEASSSQRSSRPATQSSKVDPPFGL
jgi:hypothetical protein